MLIGEHGERPLRVGGRESAAADTVDAGDWTGFGQAPGVTTRNGWLWIEPGDAGLVRPLGRLRYVHALAWRRLHPKDSEDEWSTTFLDFKNGSRAAADMVMSLLLDRLPRLLNDLVGPHEPVNLVTALSAIDTEVNPTVRCTDSPRCWTRRSCVVIFEIACCARRHTSGSRIAASLDERAAAVDGVYLAAADADDRRMVARRRIDNGVFLILDDFVTRGSTFADISRALRGAFPYASIHAAALAKHVWADTLRSWGCGENDYNRHLPPAATS